MPSALPFEYLSDDRMKALNLSTAEITESIEQAVRDKAAGRALAAPKVALLPGDGRYIMATLAASDAPPLIVVKSVMVSPRNPARGLPGINGAILMLDSETGALVAVADANWITGVRTAALSAIMARRLANPEASVAAFVGAGVQARSHLDAFAALLPLREVRVLGRGRAGIDAFCRYARDKGLEARAPADPRAALEGADIVISAVTLSYDIEPFLDAGWLKPGAFAAITDLALPWVPATLTAFDVVMVDDRAQEAAADAPMVDPARISGDLDGVVTGAAPAAFDPARRSAFIFRGLAIADLAVAALAYGRATAAA